MIVAATPDSQGFDIFLDDELLRFCFLADDEQGVAYVSELDSSGRPAYTTHQGRRTLKLKRVEGSITILGDAEEWQYSLALATEHQRRQER